MSRSRILCVTDSLHSGSSQSQLVEIALFLCQIGYDVEFLVYKPDDSYEYVLKQQGIAVTRIAPCNLLQRFFRIRKFIRNGGFNLVIAFHRTPSFICELAGLPRRSWKLVVSERSSRRYKPHSFLEYLYAYFHIYADSIVCNTFSNCNLILQSNTRLDPDKVQVIYNCHDFSGWKQPYPLPTATAGNKLRMVIAANVSDITNLNVFIDAMLRLTPQERSVLHVEWYGCGSKKSCNSEVLENVNKEIQQKKIHLMASNLPYDLTEIIAESDIVGLFSYKEKLPRELCTAMAAGKPIISANVSDFPLLVEEGRGGFTCDAENPSSIADALRKMIRISSSQRHEMGRYNTQRARFLFCKEHTVQRYVVLFQKLLTM
ncbi:MAG: glycosyltransferase family 4 protein [Bacteroidota bacterium]|nr:glycosyltransferase family 4 protein [Bacteroidota bacterium]